jgi:hypothetical protein
MRSHFVSFYSPGTLFAEESTFAIESLDPKVAVGMAERVVERYGATPYGFRFETRLTHPPVPDGEGGVLEVKSRPVGISGVHFLGGRLETLDELDSRNDPKEEILRSNMRANGWPIVCVNENSFRSVQPFEEGDRIVDAEGNIVERGEDPKHVQYRASVAKRR